MDSSDNGDGVEFELNTEDYKEFVLRIKSPDELSARQFLRLMAEWLHDEASALVDDDTDTINEKRNLLLKRPVH